MKHPMRSSFVVVALVGAATGLAACGDDDKGGGATATATAVAEVQQTSIPTTPPAKVDPKKASWASKFCVALAPGNKDITPPNMQGTSPADTQASIVTFFTTVSDQQQLQLKAIDQVGAPPGSRAKRDWRKADGRLEDINKTIEGLVTDVKAQDAKTPEDVQKLVTQLGKTLKEFGTYGGVVADLASSKSLGDAIKADPGCKSLL
ncbi:MAG: hypothetical protein PGN13_08685 [Patulibacter minatonensis]